jgi:hypothetical protein
MTFVFIEGGVLNSPDFGRGGIIPYVFNHKGQLLFLLGHEPSENGKFCDFGGGCKRKKKETLIQCTFREFHEELEGCVPDPELSQLTLSVMERRNGDPSWAIFFYDYSKHSINRYHIDFRPNPEITHIGWYYVKRIWHKRHLADYGFRNMLSQISFDRLYLKLRLRDIKNTTVDYPNIKFTNVYNLKLSQKAIVELYNDRNQENINENVQILVIPYLFDDDNNLIFDVSGELEFNADCNGLMTHLRCDILFALLGTYERRTCLVFVRTELIKLRHKVLLNKLYRQDTIPALSFFFNRITLKRIREKLSNRADFLNLPIELKKIVLGYMG